MVALSPSGCRLAFTELSLRGEEAEIADVVAKR
jgi:hypothetical protein